MGSAGRRVTRSEAVAGLALVFGVVYLLVTGWIVSPPVGLRGLLIALALYLAYRLVRAAERLADATERLAED